MEKKKKFTIAGKEIEVSTGKLARQATAAVQIRSGNTILLVTVTKSEKAKKELDYFPLMVDFEEKIYSVGRIPGSYNRREGRASDKAVLTSRLIDRPIRPLFPDAYRNEVQVNVMTLSVDQLCPPDTLGMLGVGFALELSGLPVAGEVGAVRISLDADANFMQILKDKTENSNRIKQFSKTVTTRSIRLNKLRSIYIKQNSGKKTSLDIQ